MTTSDYDVVVVGGGPAGSSAAYYLASSGNHLLWSPEYGISSIGNEAIYAGLGADLLPYNSLRFIFLYIKTGYILSMPYIRNRKGEKPIRRISANHPPTLQTWPRKAAASTWRANWCFAGKHERS